MKLSDRVSTLGGMLNRADKTGDVYEFFDVDDRTKDQHVVTIPVSLDQRRDTLSQMIAHRTTIQAEQHRLENELAGIDREIHKHQVAFSKEMLLLQIPAPMASEAAVSGNTKTPPNIPDKKK